MFESWKSKLVGVISLVVLLVKYIFAVELPTDFLLSIAFIVLAVLAKDYNVSGIGGNSWKTTVTGVITGLAAFLLSVFKIQIPTESVLALGLFILAIVSKDYNKDGIMGLNWRTTITGVVTALAVLLNGLFNIKIPEEILVTAGLVVLSIFIKDFNVTNQIALK